jgi:peptidoglycan hydrolase-like protein with peptidoglycan-binding domain
MRVRGLLLPGVNRRFLLTVCAALAPVTAIAAGAFTSLHPEEAIPDPAQRVSQGPHADFISRVQQKLRALGFDAGPVNGDFGTKTQAALAQFQLSRAVPASGQLDEQTLAELGVVRDDAQGSAGASAQPARPELSHQPQAESAEKPAR